MRPDPIAAAAWAFLLREQVTELPVRPSGIARRNQIALYLYEDFAHSAQCGMEEVARRYGPDGFTIRYPDGHFLIFYNHGNPQRCRWTIMHELAHIFLGHFCGSAPAAPRPYSQKDPCDVQADRFAAQALCPDVVAHFCKIGSARELRALTDLSMQASVLRWQELCARRAANDFLCTPEESLLYRQFLPFIEKHREFSTETEPTVEIPPLRRAIYRF